MAGDVGIVPRNMGHFIENLSDDEPLEVLEIFRAGKRAHCFCERPQYVPVANILISDEFQDFSLFQWMGETPKRLVQDHLFQHDPKSGEKFAKVVESAKKDVIKSQYEKSPGLQSKSDL
jgi:oxalate decarboxylase/phosphoglucose isomerase-like protein (cupin superfamily)